ncbi:unnamed protein product, partial [Trichobilharzia regenti]
MLVILVDSTASLTIHQLTSNCTHRHRRRSSWTRSRPTCQPDTEHLNPINRRGDSKIHLNLLFYAYCVNHVVVVVILLLIRTISRSIPGLLRFCVCALILFFAFSLCGWVVLGPYNLKFRTFMSTVECLYSLINGDDMFVTFTIINENDPIGIYLFSRLFLYLFITLFIYVVLNLFVTIIFEAYEEVKVSITEGNFVIIIVLLFPWGFNC